jgi:hypothetical protein
MTFPERACDEESMAGSQLRLLNDELNRKIGEYLLNLASLVADNHTGPPRGEGASRFHNVFQQRLACKTMEYLGKTGLEPSPLTRG